MDTKSEIHHQHNVELRRFQRACDQILQLNGKLDDLSRRYMSARDNNNKLFRYSLRSRMLVVEGMLSAYCSYAEVKKEEILKLRRQLANENNVQDEMYLNDNGDVAGNNN